MLTINTKDMSLMEPVSVAKAKRLNWTQFRLEYKSLYALLLWWRHRAKARAQLASMSDFMLKDIGVTRLDANVEASKKFWQP